MPRVPLPMPSRAGEMKSKFVSAQTLINCFVEMHPQTGPAIYGWPGLTLFATCGDGPIRGMIDFSGALVVVSGSTLYSVSRTGAVSPVGTISGTTAVIMAHNGFQVVIVAEDVDTSYVYDGVTVAEITDADFLGGSSVDFIDQYFVFTRKDSQQFFVSALADGASYDATDVASAEAKPDNLLRVIVDNREVMLFGTKSVEGWYNAGDADFPLARSTTFVEYGLAGRNAVAKADNTVFWLAPDNTVRALRGGTPQIISDHAVSNLIEAWSDPSATSAFVVSFRGHTFFVLRNPDGCVAIDAATGLPFELVSYEMDTWRVGCAEFVWNGTVLGDAENGAIYRLDPDAFDENGEPHVREWVSSTMNPSGSPFTLDEVEIDIEVGVGLVSGQGSNPVVWMKASRDSGESWGARMEREIGARGDRELRVVWEDFGQFPTHGGAISMGISDPVRFVVTRGWATFTEDRP
jgi:hypothetical protein